MKALLYKEFKLAMHPMIYVFVCVFPLMILIPSYPIAVGFIYVVAAYPILFLGANKGQQSNDLLYSTLLPVRKKDIVLARIMTVAIMQFAFIAIMSLLYPLAVLINKNTSVEVAEQIAGATNAIGNNPGLGLSAYVSVLAIAVVGFALADLIFFPIYYKNGKSIVMSTLFMIIGYVLYLGIFTIAIPYIPGCEGYISFFAGVSVWIQFIYLFVAIIIYVGIHVLVYRISAKRLEHVDF